MTTSHTPEGQTLADNRREILTQLEEWLETPMLVLGFVWLALLVWELIWDLNPILETISLVIWIIFILNFVVEFTLAPHKLDYLKRNWLTAISLVLPALRVFRLARVLRLLRGARGLRLVKVVGSLNRGMRALGASMNRRGLGYVITLTTIVTLAGAAGMYAFENDNAEGGGLNTYGEALWWTAMIMTTMGSAYWPQTAEGRVLCLILAMYAFAVFGYVTATLATFFIGRDAESDEAEVAGAKSLEALRAEIRMLREELRQ
ncbi:MAG TPA: ion transporter [Pyrinomonadaceae bacterium]|jgi:voltage-gated potassium channel|nr:ion transporter [Pyrinomonadaceae bacterium]